MSTGIHDAGAPARLLIVDDNSLSRRIAASTLQHAGFEVSEADSGAAALMLFTGQRFDLILLDLIMPGMDGYEVCRRIRTLPHGALVPILMFTGVNDTESIDLAYQHGATDFITKPINWSLLSHRVRYALRASAAAESTRRTAERLRDLARMGQLAERYVQIAPQATARERPQEVGPERLGLGVADVDTDGDGAANPPSDLDAIGIDEDERRALKRRTARARRAG